MGTQAVDVTGRSGMVASVSPLASEAGREMLLSGGNAIDAAVATALALCVTQPSSNGLAGYGGTMVVYLADEKRTVALDYNCRAPKAARPDMYKLEVGPGDYAEFPKVVGRANYWGPMAVSIPGTMAGLSLAHRTYGKLPWAKVLEPAHRLASEGFAVYEGLPENFDRFAANADPESVEAIVPGGRFPSVGETWVQADLGRTFEILASDPDSIYRGELARRIVDRVRAAGGILTEEDMADFTVAFTDSVKTDYRGVTLHAPPGVTGSICAYEGLAILQKLSADAYRAQDPGYWADFADAFALAWRDRLAFTGDVPGIEERNAWMTGEDHAAELASLIRAGKVGRGNGGYDPLKETVHLTTCDADHNTVSLTQTHGGGWGTRFAIPGTGLVIGHGMSRFDPRPDHPNCPNSRKKPLHNMSPLVLTKGDELIGTIGLPGGRTIPMVVANAVIGMLDFGYTPAQCVNAPRIHTEDGPVAHADDLPAYAREAIAARGHALKAQDNIGGNLCVLRVSGKDIVACSQAGPDTTLALP